MQQRCLQAAGKAVSAAVVGLMVHRLSPRTCFLVVAALPLLVVLSSSVMHEERTPCCGGRRREFSHSQALKHMAGTLILMRKACCQHAYQSQL